MRTGLHKRWWFLAVCLVAGIVAFRHFWVWLPEHRYANMTQQNDLLAALNAADNDQVEVLSHRHGYDYQIFNGDQLIQSSNLKLPQLQLVRQAEPAAGVITASLTDRLQAMRPYQIHIGFHRYIFFAVSSRHQTYIMYSKVF
jgi:hypothetical protein